MTYCRTLTVNSVQAFRTLNCIWSVCSRFLRLDQTHWWENTESHHENSLFLNLRPLVSRQSNQMTGSGFLSFLESRN